MPLIQNTNRTYISIDPDSVEFRQKTGEDSYITSPVYTGKLRDVRWQENEFQGRPNNRFLFVFEGEDGAEEILQSGEGSVFSSALINKLLSVEGRYGNFRIGLYKSEGGYIVPWVEHNGDSDNKLQEKYGFDEFDRMANRSFNGDKAALTKKLVEEELQPKIKEQGTMADLSGSVESTTTVSANGDIDGSQTDLNDGGLDDLDDDLPF